MPISTSYSVWFKSIPIQETISSIKIETFNITNLRTMEFECFLQLTHFNSFKFELIPILEPKFSLEINSSLIKVIITLKFESVSWSIQWNSTWFKPIPVLESTGNPIFWFYVIENLGTISYKPLQLLLQKWHFSDKNSAITRQGIKISKNGLHPRIRRAILHRHTNFQPNLSHSGNHLFPVDTLPIRYIQW